MNPSDCEKTKENKEKDLGSKDESASSSGGEWDSRTPTTGNWKPFPIKPPGAKGNWLLPIYSFELPSHMPDYRGFRGACYKCHQRGHMARDCPDRAGGSGAGGASGGGGGSCRSSTTMSSKF